MGFFEDVLSPGMIALITATMRAGKSNIASFLIEMGVPLGYHFYTNLKFYDYDELDEAIKQKILTQEKDWYRRVPPEVHTVDSYSELFLNLILTRPNITIIDEAIVVAGSKKGVSKDIRWFEDFVTQSGKFHTAVVLIAQAKGKLSTLIKEDLPNHEIKMYKISFNNRYAEVWFNPPEDDPEEPGKLRTWTDVPPSKYPYDHLAPGGFEPDLDIEQFLTRVGKLKSTQVKYEVPIIIQEMLQKNVKKPRITKKQKVKDKILMYPDESNEKIAKVSGCTPRYVQQIRKELNIS